jgi:hypothetical protein
LLGLTSQARAPAKKKATTIQKINNMKKVKKNELS